MCCHTQHQKLFFFFFLQKLRVTKRVTNTLWHVTCSIECSLATSISQLSAIYDHRHSVKASHVFVHLSFLYVTVGAH